MNFKTVAGIRDQKDAKNNPIKLDMFCVLDSMEKPDDYGNPRFKATDDNKNQRTVKFKGNTKPDASLLSHRVLISCWGKSYTDSRGQDKTSYEAWLKNANVSQTSPQQAPQSQQAKNPSVSTIVAPDSKDASICRQTAGKVVAQILSTHGFNSVKDMYNIILEVAVPLAKWFETGELPKVEEEPADERANSHGTYVTEIMPDSSITEEEESLPF